MKLRQPALSPPVPARGRVSRLALVGMLGAALVGAATGDATPAKKTAAKPRLVAYSLGATGKMLELDLTNERVTERFALPAELRKIRAWGELDGGLVACLKDDEDDAVGALRWIDLATGERIERESNSELCDAVVTDGEQVVTATHPFMSEDEEGALFFYRNGATLRLSRHATRWARVYLEGRSTYAISEGRIYAAKFGAGPAELAEVDLKSGKVSRLSIEIAGPVRGVAVVGDEVFVAGEGIRVFDRKSGKLRRKLFAGRTLQALSRPRLTP